MMKMPWETLLDDVTSLASEFIEDPDKKNELNFKADQLKEQLSEKLLDTKTVPWVDSFVKILITTRDIILPMLRPLGAMAMTGFGMYCHYKGITVDQGMHMMMDGAFPAWGASRHVYKNNELKAQDKTKKGGDDPFWFEPD